MERSSTYIKVWFWPRNSASVPAAVKNGASSADTSTFGTPFADFVNTNCDIPSHFGSHHIIINLTLCESIDFFVSVPSSFRLIELFSGGDWAGQQSIYASAGCPGTCVGTLSTPPCIPSIFTNFVMVLRLCEQQSSRVQERVLRLCWSPRLSVDFYFRLSIFLFRMGSIRNVFK